MARQRALRKARVTMTIAPRTVVALDQAVEAHGFPSRSSALREWAEFASRQISRRRD